jgi:polar amino acid transport system substrate-binding protein
MGRDDRNVRHTRAPSAGILHPTDLVIARRSAGYPRQRHITGYTVLANERLKVAVLSGQVQRDHALRLGVDAADLLEFSIYSEAAEAVLQGRAAAYASVALAHTEHLSVLAERQRWRLTSVTVPSIEVSPALGAFACASDDIRIALDGALAELVGSDSPGEPSAEPSAWVGA